MTSTTEATQNIMTAPTTSTTTTTAATSVTETADADTDAAAGIQLTEADTVYIGIAGGVFVLLVGMILYLYRSRSRGARKAAAQQPAGDPRIDRWLQDAAALSRDGGRTAGLSPASSPVPSPGLEYLGAQQSMGAFSFSGSPDGRVLGISSDTATDTATLTARSSTKELLDELNIELFSTMPAEVRMPPKRAPTRMIVYLCLLCTHSV